MVKFQSTLEINQPIRRNLKKPETLLQRSLTPKQKVLSDYLISNVFTALIYIFNFTADICLAVQFYRNEDFIFGSITLFLMYVPAIGSIFFTLSDLSVWPEETGFGCNNVKWMLVKFIEHLFFPIWAMYRFAEQIFWSIEAYRFQDTDKVDDLLINAKRNSFFELYHFLQAYLQAAPQILFQLNIIFKQTSKFHKTTVDMQVFCVILSLMKMALTTASYQRFKSQKSTGRKYPWKKDPPIIQTIQETYKMLGSNTNLKENEEDNTELNATQENEKSDQEDETIFNDGEEEAENSEPEADRNMNGCDLSSGRNSGLSVTSSQFELKLKKKIKDEDAIVSIHSSESSTNSETKFRKQSAPVMIPMKVISYRGLPEDDSAGKLVSFFWWFTFILPRMICLSAFAYFYQKEIWWLCASHYIICLAFLLYDAHISDIPYYRAVFILFTAYIYMFCLIEFKIKFKKVKFIYYGYFLLVYFENFVMTCVWYFNIDFDNDWWYRYIFYLIVGSSLISVTSMILYLKVFKPKKITLHQELRDSKIL